VLGEDTGGDLVDLADQLEHGVFSEMLLGELALRDVAGIGLAENGVTIAGNDTAGLEGGPQVLLDLLVAKIIANGLLHLLEPFENLLVGEAVERAGQTVETGSQGEVGRAQSAANQVGGVRADVAALVVGVDGEVQTHQLDKVLVVSEAKLVGQVEAVILVLLDRGNLSILVGVAIDRCGNGWELGDEVHRIVESVFPVLGLGHALSIGFCEGGFALEGRDGSRELSHRVQILGQVVEELQDVVWDLGELCPLGRESANLRLGGDLAGQEEPEETLRKRLLTAGCLGKKLLAFWDLGGGFTQQQVLDGSGSCSRCTHSLATEADSLFRVEDGALLWVSVFRTNGSSQCRTAHLPHKRLDATSTAVDLVKRDLADDLVAVLPTASVSLSDLMQRRRVNWAMRTSSAS